MRFRLDLTTLRRWSVWFLYATTVSLFSWQIHHWYHPGFGFNQIVAFGEKLDLKPIPEVLPLNRFVERDGYGYDGQYYAQIAMHPLLDGAELRSATDWLQYRARRILTSWTAFVFGGGKPSYVLKAYTALNVVVWFILAAVLLHWFPPASFSNWFRWTGILLSAGMCQTVRLALVDGLSLTLLCIGVWLIESKRPRLATLAIGLTGLARETTLISGISAFARGRTATDFRRFVVRTALIACPLVCWLLYIYFKLGGTFDGGGNNFGVPLLAYARRCYEAVVAYTSAGGDTGLELATLLVLTGIGAQVAFLIIKPQPSKLWWRVGIGSAALFAFLGVPVWEGLPGAAPRVLLPMQVAFNVLVPDRARWAWLLFCGNVAIVCAPVLLKPPPHPGVKILGSSAALTNNAGTADLKVTFDAAWGPGESGRSGYWRWSRGNAKLTLTNPHDRPLAVNVSFIAQSLDSRSLQLATGGKIIWTASIAPRHDAIGKLDRLVLAPGDTEFSFSADRPAKILRGPDSPAIAFGVANLLIAVPEPPKQHFQN